MPVLGHKHTLEIGKFSGHPINFTYHLIIPSELALTFKEEKIKRVLIIIGQIQMHKPILNYKGVYFCTLPSSKRKKLKLEQGDQIEVVLKKDDSTYQIEIAEEMKVLLEQDIEADQYFHALTPGKQRSLLYIVNKIKSPDLRLTKALIIVDHLKANNGKLDFKMLNQAFKNG